MLQPPSSQHQAPASGISWLAVPGAVESRLDPDEGEEKDEARAEEGKGKGKELGWAGLGWANAARLC